MGIPGTHDSTLVALSVLIAAAASYTALDLAGRIRACSGWSCHAWLATAAVAMGGGIWSMHFVAMLAFSMPGMEVNYDLGLTAVSLVAPILVTGAAFYVVNRQDTGTVALALSGLFMGLGIVAMHYIGMSAMRMPADLRYDKLWVVISALIAIGASTVALFLAFRRANVGTKAAASVAMGLAVSGMHYAAMQGAVFTVHGHTDGGHEMASIGQTRLAVAVAATTFLILFFALVAAMFDRRFAGLAEREAGALRQSEERFRLLLKSVTDYAIFMLDTEGRVANWNAGAERIKGYSADEIVGAHFSQFYTPEEIANKVPARALETAAREGKFEAEGWRVRKDGTQFWASVVIDPVKDDQGNLIGYAKVTRDITERKASQDALQQAQMALLQAQKMEAVGQLTGGVAHDFNNLLMAALGSLELLRKRMPDDPKLLRLLDNAVQAAQRGASLTQRMLAFARRQDLKPTPVDVPDLVHGMTDMLQRTIGPTIQIETHFPLGLARALIDANQLELALLNLAVNARDAMPEGGTITISGREAADESDVSGLEAARRYVCLSVTDTGEGMDARTVAKAMEPFFTTKGVGKGTGLGLSMIHGLAEQSGGRLILHSKEGVGTTAEIWLPVAEASQDAFRPLLEIRPPAIRGRALSVLVVDDDPLVLQNVGAMLEDLGHRVSEVPSGADALRMLQSESGIDLVLTDHVMPGMTGLELVNAIRERWPSIRVVLATGYSQLDDISGARGGTLVKPFTQQALQEAISLTMSEKDHASTVLPFRSPKA
ncbi:PAS domain S-box protein [Tardiphaga sp. vice352]|uniref:MHYT domain-containing protein n=1 Tax=unclassified Tardiphaga TaxID=2631404 RepID=UPI0011624EA7|nr:MULTISPECIES: MHYT domain-containing protein [unclassified Tardiphaga]QDM26343.1 PAS domain S-box protein [Tardiphaga sp. vice304]QDM31411.1 PAS domain S-box protein [Tardiphaga sp. vice352]